MDQSITIKIEGRSYQLKATSTEQEQIMRIAAEKINEKLSFYGSRYPDKQLSDKLAFVALNETIAHLTLQKKLKDLDAEARQLESLQKDYLDNI